MKAERIVIAGHELVIARPNNPESLIDEARFGENEFLPYWADLWPSGFALASYIAGLELAGKRVLELGCGLALPSFAAALAGAEVVATDWAVEAVALVKLNASANGLQVKAAALDWGSNLASKLGVFDLVLAADVLYEERNARPLLRVLEAVMAPGGEALVADPGRRHAVAFFGCARAEGWSAVQIAADEIPAGGIVRLLRPAVDERG
jgi:predicted nicotinamide N-methyase